VRIAEAAGVASTCLPVVVAAAARARALHALLTCCHLILCPLCLQLLEHPQIGALFPADVIDRARVFLSDIPGGVGAYSDSAGALVLRKQIAAAIERRDGHPASPDEIYLTVGWGCGATG
jgi:aspartate/methionine/tyrosine aminotransferase